MPDNVISDVFEGVGSVVKQTVKQAAKTPIKILETAATQASGQTNSTSGMPDEVSIRQQNAHTISQMKAYDDQNSKVLQDQIRQNIRAMMQVKSPAQQEIPKYIRGKSGFSLDKVNKQQEEAEKQKNKLPDLSEYLKLKNRGSGERHRGSGG